MYSCVETSQVALLICTITILFKLTINLIIKTNVATGSLRFNSGSRGVLLRFQLKTKQNNTKQNKKDFSWACVLDKRLQR
jgi:hypothetical protein